MKKIINIVKITLMVLGGIFILGITLAIVFGETETNKETNDTTTVEPTEVEEAKETTWEKVPEDAPKTIKAGRLPGAPEVAPAVTATVPVKPVADTPITSVQPSEPIVSTPETVTPLEPELSISAYDGGEWGNHNSKICADATIGAFTGVIIEKCDVDHVVALKEAHDSGGWAWGAAKKKQFTQDNRNHLATLACVNRSKGSRDAGEWTKTWVAKSKACNGGYILTNTGWCRFATITIAVKESYGLSIDHTEELALQGIMDNECNTDTDEAVVKPVPTVVETQPPTYTPPVSTPDPVSPVTTNTCTHNGRGHSFLGYNPGTHTHPTSHSHESGKCEGV